MGLSNGDTHGPSASDLKAVIEAEKQGVPFVFWRDGERVQHILVLQPGSKEVTIGRRADQKISLPWDHEVSRIHALLDPAGDHWAVVDEGSSNGTHVNGSRIEGRRRLDDKDRMCFGSTTVTFRDPNAPDGNPSTTRHPPKPGLIEPSAGKRRVLIALCRPVHLGTSATPATNEEIAKEVDKTVDAVKANLREMYEAYGLDELPQNEKRAQLVKKIRESGMLRPHEF
jgi:hypothetical protein